MLMDFKSHLLLLLACCVLLQALPARKDQNVKETLSMLREKRAAASDGTCLVEDGQTISVGEGARRLVTNNHSLLITSTDLCFVVSGVNTMPDSDRWIQNLATDLDQQLKSEGVGSQTGHENRFCVIHYGAKNEKYKAEAIQVEGQVFFGSDKVTKTRPMLKNNGFVADGYEALQYTITNLPFRQSPTVARSIILISDTGRSVLADQVGLTKDIILSRLEQHSITLDVITNITVTENILGLMDYHTSVLYENDHTHINRSADEVVITGSHGDSLTSYAELAFQTGGGAWLLEPMYEDVKSNCYRHQITTLAKGYVASRSYLSNDVCETCQCISSDGQQPVLKCQQPRNQYSCILCLDNDEEECQSAVNVTGGYLLNIKSFVTQEVDGSATNISFHANRGDVVYQCILMDSVHPSVDYCVSPVMLADLPSGQHQFMIVGRTLDGQSLASEIVNFTVSPKDDSPLSIDITNRALSDDGQNMAVSFATVSPYVNGHVTVMCKIDNGQFSLCTSPIEVRYQGSWVRQLTLMAFDEFGGFVSKQENVHFTGKEEIKFEKGGVDSNGAVTILLYSSDTPSVCLCFIQSNPGFQPCTPASDGSPGRFVADPAVIGSGTHTLQGRCEFAAKSHNIVDTFIEVNLQPKQEFESIDCSLEVNGPYSNDTITADFDCNDRSAATTCIIDSLPSQNCSKGHSFSTQSLLPGYHLFTLSAASSHGSPSTTIIQPFFINATEDFQCQPEIKDAVASTASNGRTVTLELSTSIGTCTSRDDFSYEISWGDGSSLTGVTAGHVTPLSFTRTYLFPGQYPARVKYCRNTCRNVTSCCTSITLSVETS